MSFRVFILFISIIIFKESQGQTYNFRNYTVEDGLSRSEILSIFQDNKGRIGLGTAGGGINFFDGKSFSNLSSRNGLINNDINYILQAKNGTLWVATNGGVSCIKGSKITNFTKRNGLVDNNIISLMEDSDGNIWLRSLEHGVSMFDVSSEKFKNYSTKTGLSDNVIYDFLESGKNVLFFASYKGLNSLDKKTGKIFSINLGAEAPQISSVVKDKTGTIWLGTWGSGLIKYDPEKKTYQKFKIANGPFGNDIIISLALGKNNELWVGTLGSGLLKFNKGNIQSYSSNKGHSIDFINKLKVDSKGDVWIITSDESLYRLTGDLLINYNSRNGLNDDKVKIVFEDREGNIWLGTQKGGVSKYNGDVFTFLDRKDGLDNSFIQSISGNNSGNLFISTGTKGYFTFKNSSLPSLIGNKNEKTGLHSDFISYIFTDNNDDVWLGSNGQGLFIPENKLYNKKNGLSGNKIQYISETKTGIAVCTNEGLDLFDKTGALTSFSLEKIGVTGISSCIEDSKGKLWIVSTDSILLKFDSGNFTKHNTGSRLSGALTFKDDGTLILGTEDKGILLGAFKENKIYFTNPIKAEDIGYAGITSLIYDKHNKLWIGTTNGIYSYNKGEGISLKSYKRPEGIISVVCNKNAVFKDLNNIIWFGTVNGAVRLDPSKLKFNTDTPITSITDVKLFFKNANLTKFADSIDSKTNLPAGLSLPYYNNHLTFQFIGTSLKVPEKVKYSYFLLGNDKTWSPPISENFVTFSSLPPGKYEFQVKACNNDGLWNKKPAVFEFVITPPFWRTWWFITFCILTGLGIILIIYFTRIAQVKHTANLKQKVVETEQMALRAQMNPHFIFNSLNSIQHFITDKDVKSANRYLSKFSKLMRMILDNSKKPAVSLHEELESLKLYLDLESLRFENKFEYNIEIAEDIDVYSVEIPAMLIQPYLENAIWHGLTHKTTKGEIGIKFELEEKCLICEIEDNGIGRKKAMELKIDHPAQHTSSGMRITSERLQSIGELKNSKSAVEIIDLVNENGEGTGTKVRMCIPID